MYNVLENIIAFRKTKGYSHETMSHLLDIAQSTYFKIEKGKTELTLKRLYQIAQVLETPLEKILGIDVKNSVHNVNDQAVGIQNIDKFYQAELKDTYEEHIKTLKDEIAYLRTKIK